MRDDTAMEEEVMRLGEYPPLEEPPVKQDSSVIARLFELEQGQGSHKRELEDHLDKINAIANILGVTL